MIVLDYFHAARHSLAWQTRGFKFASMMFLTARSYSFNLSVSVVRFKVLPSLKVSRCLHDSLRRRIHHKILLIASPFIQPTLGYSMRWRRCVLRLFVRCLGLPAHPHGWLDEISSVSPVWHIFELSQPRVPGAPRNSAMTARTIVSLGVSEKQSKQIESLSAYLTNLDVSIISQQASQATQIAQCVTASCPRPTSTWSYSMSSFPENTASERKEPRSRGRFSRIAKSGRLLA